MANSLSKVWFTPTRGASNWLWLSFFVVILDQATKALVVGAVKMKSSIELLPFLDIVYLENRGAAFSILHDAGGWQRWFFIVLALVVSVALMLWLRKLRTSEHLILAIGISLVLGGALGNVIDRVWHSYVIDFIYFHWKDWYFPAFNVADSAITIGAICLLIDAFLESGREKKKASGERRVADEGR
ncbi:MAG TPA: signal peptidase II [Steroidobacteraceae bacterium]|jgi:signal peptidase II